jgi:hypothetical protein
MAKTRSNPRSEARKYLDGAISRHRKLGDDQTVPKAVYDKALTRTARTYEEFKKLGQGVSGTS